MLRGKSGYVASYLEETTCVQNMRSRARILFPLYCRPCVNTVTEGAQARILALCSACAYPHFGSGNAGDASTGTSFVDAIALMPVSTQDALRNPGQP